MRINATIAAINASRNLLASNDNLGRSAEKLAASHRGHRAADDVAGASLPDGLGALIRGNTLAQREAQDGISYIQTTQGALTEVHAMLQRMRQLALQAADAPGVATTVPAGSATAATATGAAATGAAELDAAGDGGVGQAEQGEVDTLVTEIKGIGDRTMFSGTKVFANHADATLAFPVGTHDSATMDALRQDLTLDPAAPSGVFSTTLTVDLTSRSGASAALTSIDAAIDDVSRLRSALGAAQNRLEHTVADLGVAVENLTASESWIRDADLAGELVRRTRTEMLAKPATAVQAQATSVPRSILLLLQH